MRPRRSCASVGSRNCGAGEARSSSVDEMAGRRSFTVATVAVVAVLSVLGWPGWWKVEAGTTQPGPLAGALATLEVAVLVMWRRRPLLCFVVAETAVLAYGLRDYPSTPAGYAGLAATAVAGWAARRPLTRYGCLAVAAAAPILIGLLAHRPASGAEMVTNLLLVLVAWFVGRVVRTHKDAARSRVHLDHETQRRHASEARLALADALHDRVGHSLVGALRQLEAAQALGLNHERSGFLVARALQRVRTVVGEVSDLAVAAHRAVPDGSQAATHSDVIGSNDDEPGGQLREALTRSMGVLSSTGVSVSLTVHGDAASLPEAVEAAAAGLLGEALANVIAHSTAPSVRIQLELGPEVTTVTIDDPGPSRVHGPGAGSGLERQRKRVEDLRGELTAGSCRDGGFAVRGRIPHWIVAPEPGT